MTSNAVLLLAANLLVLAAGIGTTGAAGYWRGGRGLSGALGVSYLAGVAAYGVVAQLLYVCGATLVRWQVIAICSVLACGAVRGFVGPDRGAPSRDRLWLLGLPIAAFCFLIAVDLWFQPLWAYDSWTFWTPKAHALAALPGLRAGWFTQADLTSRDYPILLPAFEAAGFRFTGYETSLLDLQSLVVFAALLRTIYEVSAGRARSIVLWAVLTMLAVAPSVTDQLAAAEADIVVASLFAAAGSCGALWLRGRRPGALPVAGVLAAGATATKVEGLVFALALFAALAIAAGSGRRLAPVAAGAAALLVGIVPWRIWLTIHHVPNQGSYARLTHLSYLVGHIDRLPLVLGYLAVKMFDPRAWLLVLPLFVIVLAKGRRPPGDRVALFAVVTTLLALAGLILAYWTTPLGLHYQLTTSARRVVTGVVFLCAALTPLLSSERT